MQSLFKHAIFDMYPEKSLNYDATQAIAVKNIKLRASTMSL